MINIYDLNETGGLRKLTELERARLLRQGAGFSRASVAKYSTEYDFVQRAHAQAERDEEKAKILESRR